MSPPRTISLLGAALLLCASTLAAGPAVSASLAYLARAEIGAPLPPNWKARSVKGANRPRTQVVEWQGRRAVRFYADDAAGWYGVPVAQPFDAASGRLEWSWQIGTPLAGASLREPELDDAPARMVVVFGEASIFSRPRVLFYSWGNQEAVGTSWHSYVSDRFGIMVLRNREDPVATWVTERRDLAADYARVFGGTPEPVSAVGFMIDTEQTGATGSAHLGTIEWITAP